MRIKLPVLIDDAAFSRGDPAANVNHFSFTTNHAAIGGDWSHEV
jgi:hypothetical protein